jgi:Armadillo/beta-catenin-like repeat
MQAGEVLAVPGAVGAIVRLLADSGDAELTAEVAWVLTYLTAASDAVLGRLVAGGIIPPLVHLLVSATATVSLLVGGMRPVLVQELPESCTAAASETTTGWD